MEGDKDLMLFKCFKVSVFQCFLFVQIDNAIILKMKKTYFFKLVSPRASFSQDMTQDERNIMLQHIAYWKRNMDEGKVIAFGPVLHPDGAFGIGIIQVNDEGEAKVLAENDPAITSGLNTYEFYFMPNIVVK